MFCILHFIFYIYTSIFYNQCRRYNQKKTSGQIFNVSWKVSHFNLTWPFFIGTLFAGSKPCTCLNWRLKASSDWLHCLFICLFLVADSKDQGCLSSSGCLGSILIYEIFIATAIALCAFIHAYKTWCAGAIDGGPFAFGVFRFSALLCRAWQLFCFFP